ncbi:MAG: hypothetical protein EOO88_17440 [Pedobacter sp.]|nr:MAG: hypothetical protein EOO88_17440 [Pedobacter sp.]
MFRKLTGIFILLCFLLVKNSPLAIFDTSRHNVSLSVSSMLPIEQELPVEQDSNETPQESKSSKQLEYADEDFIYQSELNFIHVLSLSKRLDNHYVKQISPTYFSLPHPPPDCVA